MFIFKFFDFLLEKMGNIRRLLFTLILLIIIPDRKGPWPEISFTQEHFNNQLERRHFFQALLGILTVLTVVFSLIQIPFFTVSLGSILALGIDKAWFAATGNQIDSVSFVLITGFYLFIRMPKKLFEIHQAPKSDGTVYGAVMSEEILFRSGSEHLSWFGRLRRSIAFGAVHFLNIIYPLAVVVALMLGAVLLNHIYIKKFNETGSQELATRETAIVHTLYNVLTIVFFVIWIVFWTGYLLFQIF